MHRALCVLLLLCASCTPLAYCGTSKSAAPRGATSVSNTMPITTSSAVARYSFEKGMAAFLNAHIAEATDNWRSAAKEDPSFALAHAWIAFNTGIPAEENEERTRAKALEANVTPGERLMIRWIVGVKENDFLTGITAMNDMVAMFPKDKRVLYLAGNWLLLQESNEPTVKFMQRVLAMDGNYPSALNDLGYAYSGLGDYDKAIAAMDRYVKALPNDPNPQDSYGEILRQAGRFNASLDHYRAALKIDPKYFTSHGGLGDTYALMGDQLAARLEYARAIEIASGEDDRMTYILQSATTWVREKKYQDADQAFTEAADQAHTNGLHLHEASARRMMAMYQEDDNTALKYLDAAESDLTHQASISLSDREEERARILLCRTMRAYHAKNSDLAQEALRELTKMAANSRSRIIQRSYHAAAGAVELSKGNYVEAAKHLEENPDDPLSLELLARSYDGAGRNQDVQIVKNKLRTFNFPTIEQALIAVSAQDTKSPEKNFIRGSWRPKHGQL
ncbi:MAG: tetratricopeptide repeat protein [Acidobacteriaceae bacterium]|nr:tetratricopeptide repeat protein [Acidobacteriaceae bacterium]